MNRTLRIFTLPIIIISFLFVSLVTVSESSDRGEMSISIDNEASALFCCRRILRKVRGAVRRATRAVSRAARQTVRAVSRTANRVSRGVTKVTRGIDKAVKNTANKIGKGVKKAAQGVAKGVKNVTNKIVKGVEGVAALAKKGLTAVGDAVKKGLLAMKDLLAWVWKTMKNKLLRPVANYFKGAVDRAKGALQRLVNKAVASLRGVFMDRVLAPAMGLAFKKLFPNGNETLNKVKAIAERVLGRVDRVVQQSEAFAEAMQALAAKNLTRYTTALARFDAALKRWTTITLADLAGQLVAWAKERVEQFVRGKTLDLLSKAYKVVETPINAGKTAALSAISSIPVVGGAIAGAADVVITTGLGVLRDKGFQFIGNEAAKLAGRAVNWIGTYVVRGAAAIDRKLQPVLQPILATLKPLVQRALGLVGTVQTKWSALRNKLHRARAVLANAQAAVR